MIPPRFAPILAEMEPLAARFRAAGHRLYLVGGTVRDLLMATGDGPLDPSVMDFDATTTARPDEIKKIVADIADALWTQGERFGTIGLKIGERVYEITTHRAEAYSPIWTCRAVISPSMRWHWNSRVTPQHWLTPLVVQPIS
jgi:poly(A) polymerase